MKTSHRGELLGLVFHFHWADVFWASQTPALICLVNNTEQKTLFNKIINKHLKQFFFGSMFHSSEHCRLTLRSGGTTGVWLKHLLWGISKAQDPKQTLGLPVNIWGINSPSLPCVFLLDFGVRNCAVPAHDFTSNRQEKQVLWECTKTA